MESGNEKEGQGIRILLRNLLAGTGASLRDFRVWCEVKSNLLLLKFRSRQV